MVKYQKSIENLLKKKAIDLGIDKIEVDIYIKSYLNNKTKYSDNDNKIYAAIAYITLIGFIMAYVKNNETKSSLVTYHLKHVVGFIFVNLIAFIIVMIILIPSIFIGMNGEYLGFIFITSILLWGVVFYSYFFSFYNAIKGLAKPAPFFGLFFEKMFVNNNYNLIEEIRSQFNVNSFSKDFIFSLIKPLYIIITLVTWLFLLQVNNSDQKMLYILFLIFIISGFILNNKINIKIGKIYFVLFITLFLYSTFIRFDIFREISKESYNEFSVLIDVENKLKEYNTGYYSKLFGSVNDESIHDWEKLLGYLFIICELLAITLILYKLTQLINKFIQIGFLKKSIFFLEKNNRKIIYGLIIFLTLNMSLSTYLAYKNKTDLQKKIILLKQKSSKNETKFSHPSGIDENKQDTSTDINVEKILIARFIDCQVGDLIHYIFEDYNGQQFDFSTLPDNYKLIDNNYNVNPEFVNKKFKIKWKAVPDNGGEESYPYNEIITIELIE
jgi:hypothetical protein